MSGRVALLGKVQRDVQTLASSLYMVGLDKEDRWHDIVPFLIGVWSRGKGNGQQAPHECRISRDSQGQRPRNSNLMN